MRTGVVGKPGTASEARRAPVVAQVARGPAAP
jgi:hypothetical protein